MFLKISRNSRVNNCAKVPFLIKLQALDNSFKEYLWMTAPQISDSLTRVGIMLILETWKFLPLSPNQCPSLWRWCKLTLFLSLNLLVSQVWKKYISGSYAYPTQFPLSDRYVSGRSLLYVCLVYFLFWYCVNQLHRKLKC